MKHLSLILLLISLTACSSSADYLGSGSNRVIKSPCVKKGKPFYINGSWL